MHRAVSKENTAPHAKIYGQYGVRFTIAHHNLLNINNRNTKKDVRNICEINKKRQQK